MLNSTLKIAATAKGLNRVDREPGLLSGFLVPPTVYEVVFKKGFSVSNRPPMLISLSPRG